MSETEPEASGRGDGGTAPRASDRTADAVAPLSAAGAGDVEPAAATRAGPAPPGAATAAGSSADADTTPDTGPDSGPDTGPADAAAAITRGVARLCRALGWAPLREVSLANGRRADLLALLPGGGFAIVEVKSGPRDFLTDSKWPEYREFCDRLYFAVDHDFPRELIPEDAGLIVADAFEAHILREPPAHPLAPARRRALLARFAELAALRLEGLIDPGGLAGGRYPVSAD